MKVAGKTLVVTGAGSGIGRAVTLEAVRRGARVAAVDLNPATLAETAHQVVAPQMLSAHELDLTDRAAVEALPGAVVERWAAVDGVIHCAGTFGHEAALQLATTFHPVLRHRSEAHLVDISRTGSAAPGAAKADAKQLTESLRTEFAGTSVRVTVVFAGDLTGSSADPAEQAYRAAQDILDGMERNAARVLIGSSVRLMNPLHPRRIAAKLRELTGQTAPS
ncbi:SDR family NAD(P)-dependent oxidoreductase [Actinoplanes palleronii]|uniref:SDR family NAD(P)-dependent oxidoreductase n=1 Tax=Actinoplanes palleronii TaxID=113570 RepID=UPI0019449237|nr:SDR family oxidoreductase [Actinoplanes palleronii]